MKKKKKYVIMEDGINGESAKILVEEESAKRIQLKMEKMQKINNRVNLYASLIEKATGKKVVLMGDDIMVNGIIFEWDFELECCGNYFDINTINKQ